MKITGLSDCMYPAHHNLGTVLACASSWIPLVTKTTPQTLKPYSMQHAIHGRGSVSALVQLI